jgi:CheY-like chemotaxis protein
VQLLRETAADLKVRFCVTDSSAGVAPQHYDSIFDPEAVSQFSDDRNAGSAAWSLAVSSTVVSQLGGYLQLCNQPKQGTTFGFTVVLPKVTQVVEKQEPEQRSFDRQALRCLRVLIIEPSETNQQLVQHLLLQHGVQADCASSGAIGLTFFDLYRYDAVLLSPFLPDLSPAEVMSSIRLHPDVNRAEALLVTLSSAAAYTVTTSSNASAAELSPEASHLLLQLSKLRQSAGVAAATSQALFDLSGLERMAGGSREFVARVLSSFMVHTPSAMDDIMQAAADDDWTLVASVAAKIRPTLKVLSVGRLTEAITTLEDAEKATPAERQAATEHLQRYMPQLLSELQAWQHAAGFAQQPMA